MQVGVDDADAPADDAAAIDADFTTAFYALEGGKDDTGFFVVLVVTEVPPVIDKEYDESDRTRYFRPAKRSAPVFAESA